MRGKRKLADIMSLPGYSPRQPVIFTKVKDEKKLFVEWYYIKFCRRSQKAQNKVISLPNGLQCENPPSCSSLLWSLKDVLQFNLFLLWVSFIKYCFHFSHSSSESMLLLWNIHKKDRWHNHARVCPLMLSFNSLGTLFCVLHLRQTFSSLLLWMRQTVKRIFA